MPDLKLTIREEVVAWLRAGAPLGGLPAASIYGEEPPAVPAWPFARYGLPTWENYEDSCGEGCTGSVILHAFADGAGAGTGAIYAVAGAIETRMKAFAPTAFRLIECEWVRSNVIRDGAEASKYHAVIEFRFTATEG